MEGGTDDDDVDVELVLVRLLPDELLLVVRVPLVLLPPRPDVLSLKEVLVVSLLLVLLPVFQPSFILNRLIHYHHLIFYLEL